MSMGKHKSHMRKGKSGLAHEKRLMFLIATAGTLILGFLVWISA